MNSGFCKTHHVYCKEHPKVFYLYTEACVICSGQARADQRKAGAWSRRDQAKKEERAAAAVAESSRSKGKNPAKDILKGSK